MIGILKRKPVAPALIADKIKKESVAKPAPKPPESKIQMNKQFTLPNGVNIIYTDTYEALKKIKPPMYTLGIVKTGNTFGASFSEYKYLSNGWKLMLSNDSTMDGIEKRAYDKGVLAGRKTEKEIQARKCRSCQDVDRDDDYDEIDDDEEDKRFFKSLK